MSITAKITDTSRALHVLHGLLKGISCDNIITQSEILSLREWLENHKNLSYIYPFCDAYEFIDRILEDGEISQSEQEEIIDFCESFDATNGPIDLLTMEMRNLHGFLHGIIADQKVSTDELKALEKWMLYHDSNSGKWPFDVVYGKIQSILKDGIITKSEHDEFVEFSKGFSEQGAGDVRKDQPLFIDNWMKSDAPNLKTIDSIIDHNIEIVIQGKSFCFTGQMKNGKRKEIHEQLSAKGGIPVNSITKNLNYLVIGALSNPCWAYSTYGRKIDNVIENKRKGVSTFIIHEDDFMNQLKS